MKKGLQENTVKPPNILLSIVIIGLLGSSILFAQNEEACTDPTAQNWNPLAVVDAGTCCYESGPETCSDPCNPYDDGFSWLPGGAYCEDGGQNGQGPEYSCGTTGANS